MGVLLREPPNKEKEPVNKELSFPHPEKRWPLPALPCPSGSLPGKKVFLGSPLATSEISLYSGKRAAAAATIPTRSWCCPHSEHLASSSQPKGNTILTVKTRKQATENRSLVRDHPAAQWQPRERDWHFLQMSSLSQQLDTGLLTGYWRKNILCSYLAINNKIIICRLNQIAVNLLLAP